MHSAPIRRAYPDRRRSAYRGRAMATDARARPLLVSLGASAAQSSTGGEAHTGSIHSHADGNSVRRRLVRPRKRSALSCTATITHEKRGVSLRGIPRWRDTSTATHGSTPATLCHLQASLAIHAPSAQRLRLPGATSSPTHALSPLSSTPPHHYPPSSPTPHPTARHGTATQTLSLRRFRPHTFTPHLTGPRVCPCDLSAAGQPQEANRHVHFGLKAQLSGSAPRHERAVQRCAPMPGGHFADRCPPSPCHNASTLYPRASHRCRLLDQDESRRR